MNFGVNVLITPKSGDMYDAVAVNKVPIFITCASEERLREILSNNEDIRKQLQYLLKNDIIKKTARFCYRSIEHPDVIGYMYVNMKE